MHRLLVAIGVIIGLSAAPDARAQSRVEKNVIYGMYSGLALLMDIHYPAQANGYGIVFVSGSGWQAPLNYGAVGRRSRRFPSGGRRFCALVTPYCHQSPRRAAISLSDRRRGCSARGALRASPGAAIGIDPNRLGGIGGSSGAHLIGLVAMLGAAGIRRYRPRESRTRHNTDRRSACRPY